MYSDAADVNFFWSKLDISATRNEEDVLGLSYDLDERVCDQELMGALDESYLMYMAGLK